jgi:hypothetical protein
MNITIVIQGPTNFYKEILNNLSLKQNYIWSTWNDEPKENLLKIESKIPLILSEKPNFAGMSHVNFQCLSTLKGINASNTDYIFKTRGDMIFSDIDKLLEILYQKNKELSFVHYGNPPNQIADFFSFGSKEKSYNFWNYTCQDNSSISPEMRLTNNYKEILDNKDSFEDFMSLFYFFRNDLKKDVLDIHWLKINRFFSSFSKEYNLYPKND